MKKHTIPLLFILLLAGCLSYGQEVQFPPAVLSAGGSLAPTGAVTITRWRTQQVHVLIVAPATKSGDQLSDAGNLPDEDDWGVTVYPNPVEDLMKVTFRMKDPASFRFEISDMTGKKILIRDEQLFVSGQQTEFDLSHFAMGMYLLEIIDADGAQSKVIKISKL